ncbi:MAG: YjbH domain-containing protein [Sulfurifustaceae bacterium]
MTSGLAYLSASVAEPSLTGQTGLIHMPDGRIGEDGLFRFGVLDDDPYSSVWSSLSFFSRLEVSGRYTRIDGVPGFPDAPELGDYRDKAFDAKLLLLPESTSLPALAVGAQDYLGTRLFNAQYLAVSKRVGDFDVTAGYGRRRIDGAFGGVRYRPSALPGWRFVVEYDANDYRHDFRADLSGADRRNGGLAYAVEYGPGWWGAQLARRDNGWAANVYLAVPLMQREFVPKIDEPLSYDAVTPRASLRDWADDPRYSAALARALDEQGYRDVHLRLHGDTLELALTHARISRIGRAVGRAARTALRLGPRDMARLRITYTVDEQPLLTYEFRDLAVLARYLAGNAERLQLDAQTEITFASLDTARQLRDEVLLPLDVGNDIVSLPGDDAFYAARRRDDPFAGFDFYPFNLRIFFNDPGAPVRYDTFSALTYSRRLDRGLFLNGAARLTLFENVSDIRQPSNSLLPHVRSDIADYWREGGRLRLGALLLNRYALLDERLYGRLSAGYYEEMFAGGGAQMLYLPAAGDWALDVAIDGLRQRAPGETFGFRDYSVVTALASYHYRFPAYGVTATARVGRFLAKDEGVRFELKRRFRSGIEVGGWYTWTNEKDITNPGTPEHPYYDKGLLVSIPLAPLLTRDTKERASMSIADYTRDVGQMVISPGDLYRITERTLLLDSDERDPLIDFTR